MDVSTASLVQAVAAARVALSEAFVLKVGQSLQAIVMGKGSDGLTELKIGDQVVTAKLAQTLAPGTTLQLQVKANGTTPQLAIVSQTPPATVPAPTVARLAAPTPAPVVNAPPVVVQPAAAAPKAESVQQAAPIVSQTESAPSVGAELPAVTRNAAQASTVQPAAGAPRAEPTQASAPAAVAPSAPPTEVVASPPPAAPSSRSIPQQTLTSPVPVVASATALPSEPVTQVPVQTAAASAAPIEPQASPASSPVGSSTVLPTAAPVMPTSTPTASQPASAPTVPQPAPVVTAEPEPATASPLLVAQAAPRPQATVADLPRVAPPIVQAVPAAQSSTPTTPQAALAQMVPEALAKQNSAAPLLTALAAAVERPNLLPEPILRAALGVLAQRIVVTDGKVAAATLQAAVAKSGVLLEANLAKAEPQAGDAKAGLLTLRSALAKFLGETAAPAARDGAPPPLKGLPLRAPAADLPPLPDVPRDAVRALHSQADAAVSRTKLMQLASLPDADPTRPSTPALRMELPFLIGHELVMAQLQISRDGARREVERKRGWTMRFALNFSATGEVGAEVGLLGKAVNVSLWAVEPETAEALNDALPELAAALEAIGLNPGAMRIKAGPPEPERPRSGRLLDSVT